MKSGIGNLLKIHPIVIVHQGEVIVEMVRTKGRALEGVYNKVAALGDLKKMMMVHGHAMEAAYGLYKIVETCLPKIMGTYIIPTLRLRLVYMLDLKRLVLFV